MMDRIESEGRFTSNKKNNGERTNTTTKLDKTNALGREELINTTPQNTQAIDPINNDVALNVAVAIRVIKNSKWMIRKRYGLRFFFMTLFLRADS